MIAGHSRKMGLGDFDRVSLKEAREKARDAHKLVLDGIDPIAARDARKAALALERAKAITFQECAERYIAAQEGQWRNEKHRAQWKATLTTYAYPVIGKIAVGEVDVGLVIRVLEPIWVEKNETASRLRGRIETVLSWAKVRGYRSGENPAAWRDNLKDALPRISRVRRIKHPPPCLTRTCRPLSSNCERRPARLRERSNLLFSPPRARAKRSRRSGRRSTKKICSGSCRAKG